MEVLNLGMPKSHFSAWYPYESAECQSIPNTPQLTSEPLQSSVVKVCKKKKKITDTTVVCYMFMNKDLCVVSQCTTC